MRVITKLDIKSLTKFYTVFMALFGLIMGVIMAIVSMIGGAMVEGSGYEAFGLLTIVWIPIMYAVMGAISGLILGAVINIVFKITGGIKYMSHDVSSSEDIPEVVKEMPKPEVQV